MRLRKRNANADDIQIQRVQTGRLTRRRLLSGAAAAAASLALAGGLAGCGGGDDASTSDLADRADGTKPESAATPTSASVASGVDLTAVKTFALDHAETMQSNTEQLATIADRYFELIAAADFDYEAAFAQDPQELAGLVKSARAAWLDAHSHYELAEGIVAGVPSLADFDVWIDAGPSGESDPVQARDWQLELANGEVLDRPGNLFHSLLEPALWGTNDASIGARLDLGDEGESEVIDVLPEANLFTAAAKALDGATSEMNGAIRMWEPNLNDVFSAEVTMIPTMNEYFEQWKNSVFVSGEASEEEAFVSHSRLIDVDGILTGLSTTYKEVSPAVAAVDPELDNQIQSGFVELVGFVADLLEQEASGTVFSTDEADLFGTEAQDQATALAGQVAQAAASLNVELAG